MNAAIEQAMPVADKVEEAHRPFIIFPNLSGDIVITWNADNEEYVKQLVQEKMDEGYVFFVLKPRKVFGKTLLNTKSRVKKIEDLQSAALDDKGERTVILKTEDNNIKFTGIPKSENRQVGLKQEGLGIAFDAKDEALNLAIANDKVELVKPDASQEKVSTHRAKTAEEVVKSQSVGTRRLTGG